MNELLAVTNKFMFVLIRASGVVMAAPIIGTTMTPVRIKAAFVLLLAIVLTPVVPGTAPETAGALAFGIYAVRELLIGLALGIVAAMTFGTFQLAGELIGTQMGLSMGELADPLLNQSSSAISQFLNIMAMLTLLALNGHHWFLQALGASFQSVPLGGAELSPSLVSGIVAKFIDLFVAGLKMAAPAIGVLVLVTIAIGMLARAAPLLNIMMMSFSLRIAAGLVLLGFLLPYMYKLGRYLLEGMQSDLGLLIKAM